MARYRGFNMNEEDEAFEELSRRQGDWGMQGSRKHQILRFAENVESKGTSMTQDEIIEMAKQAGISYNPGSQHDHDHFRAYGDSLKAFAKLVAAKEREACAKVAEQFEPDEKTSYVTYASTVIRARGQA